MVQRYDLKRKESDKLLENYAAVLPRIVSSPRSRQAAEVYINNATFTEKLKITRMLNEWNKETFSFEDTTSIIRPEAVPVIKNWMSAADENDVACAKNLLTFISQERKKEDEILQRNSPRPSTHNSRPSTQTSRPGTKQQKRTQWKPVSSRPGTTQSVKSSRPPTQKSQTATKTKNTGPRPTLQPKSSITYGSFYPSKFEGFGNNTSHFNIVRSNVRPKTMMTKAELYRQKYGNKEAHFPEPLSPVNRSSIFGNVVYPVPQETINFDGSVSQRLEINRPETQENGSRPATQGRSRLSTRSKARPATQGTRSVNQDGAFQKRPSDERLKFSANFYDEDVSPVNTPFGLQQKVQLNENGNETYRDLGLAKHWPGRHYQNTQYLLA